MNDKIRIEALDLSHHLLINKQSANFWGSQNSVSEFHVPLIPLFFHETSFVVMQKDLLLCYLYGVMNKRNAFVHLLATRKNHYRKGYASFLLSHWEESLHKQGVQNFYAYTLEKNILSQKFFLSQKYVFSKKIEVFHNDFRNLYQKKI